MDLPREYQACHKKFWFIVGFFFLQDYSDLLSK